MIPFIILLVVLLVAGIWIAAMYNTLIKKKQMAEEGWSGIDVQLKQRADLIPNLVNTVKGYMGHEKELLSKITELRSQSMKTESVKDKNNVEGALSRSIGNLFAVAENYPDLKANQNFQDVQQELSELEDEIQKARRYYNGTVRNLNIKIDSFPSNLVAKAFNFQKREYFEIEDQTEREVPQVEFASS